jgi:hypothetical protein
MTNVVRARIALAVIAVLVWGYGYRMDDPNVRWVAIALLVIVLALRFVPGGGRPPR